MLRISFLEFLNLFGSQNFAIKCFNSGVLLDTSEKSGLKNVMLFDQRSLCLNRPLSSRQVKKEKLRHEGLVPVSKGSQAL